MESGGKGRKRGTKCCEQHPQAPSTTRRTTEEKGTEEDAPTRAYLANKAVRRTFLRWTATRKQTKRRASAKASICRRFARQFPTSHPSLFPTLRGESVSLTGAVDFYAFAFFGAVSTHGALSVFFTAFIVAIRSLIFFSNSAFMAGR